jgi:hypothetical protein
MPAKKKAKADPTVTVAEHNDVVSSYARHQLELQREVSQIRDERDGLLKLIAIAESNHRIKTEGE